MIFQKNPKKLEVYKSTKNIYIKMNWIVFFSTWVWVFPLPQFLPSQKTFLFENSCTGTRRSLTQIEGKPKSALSFEFLLCCTFLLQKCEAQFFPQGLNHKPWSCATENGRFHSSPFHNYSFDSFHRDLNGNKYNFIRGLDEKIFDSDPCLRILRVWKLQKLPSVFLCLETQIVFSRQVPASFFSPGSQTKKSILREWDSIDNSFS